MTHADETQVKSDVQDRHPLELLCEQFSEALRAGENPSIQEFADRLPEHAEQALPILQSIALMEGASSSENLRRRAESKWQRFSQRSLTQLGDFRIVREIGRGGMGIIYEAEQLSLKRSVALKVLSPAIADSKKQLERFRRESEAIARLHHTNIVPVFGIGEEEGIHYFAMQLIDGQPLNCRLDLTPNQIARLGIQAASAVAYAHQHGVLHRDIKPSNLLLDKEQQLWVTDFGLAKLTDVGQLTQDGDIMGTLRYMAPEQLEGTSDARSDVYALGLTLYELAAKRPAFDDSTSLASRIRNQHVPSPRNFNPELPHDLETIILKTTARDAAARYQTAGELLEDLRRFADDRPILARRESLIDRTRRWMRHNPVVASSLAVTLLVLIATSLLSGWGYWTTQQALTEAKLAGLKAVQARDEAQEAKFRAEANLNVAVEAFDAIFENVARRGVPQSLTISVEQVDAPENEEATGALDPAVFESPLTTADVELLTNLLSFYREFAKRNSNDAILQLRTARAYQKSGQIQQRLGQGTEAIASYDEALNLLSAIDQAATRQDEQGGPMVAIAQVLNDRGLALFSLSATIPEVVQHHFLVAEWLKSQPEQHRRQPAVRFEIARARDLAGSVLSRKGVTNAELSIPENSRMDGQERPPERPMREPWFGRPRHDEPPPIAAIVTKYPLPEALQARLPKSFSFDFPPPPPREDGRSRGEGFAGNNRRPPPPQDRGPAGFPADIAKRIDDELNEAAALLSGLAQEFPEDERYRLALAQVQRHRMQHFLFTRRPPEASEAFEMARTALLELVDRHPGEPQYLLELADTLSYAGSKIRSISESDAEKHLIRAIEISQQLCSGFPTVPEYQAMLAASHEKLGLFEKQQQRWQTAEQHLAQAADSFAELVARYPENFYYQLSNLIVHNNLARLLLESTDATAGKLSMSACRQLLDVAIKSLTLENHESRRFVNLATQTLHRLDARLAVQRQ